MPGMKIKIDVAEAERASRRLKAELETLGHTAVENEEDFKRLEKRMMAGFEAGKAERAINGLRKSMNLTRLETARLQTNIGDYGGALKTLTSDIAQNVRGLSKMQAVLGALSVGGMAYATKSILDNTVEMQKNATMAGLSIKSYQELSYAANKYSISQDALTDGFKELNLRAEEFIVTGAGPGKEAFERLGYSQGELNRKLADAPALFNEIIDRMEGMSKASKMRLADEIFGGQGGEQFVALIDGGSDAVRKFIREANDLGLVLDNKTARGAIEANKAVDKLSKQLNMQLAKVVSTLAPDINTLAENTGTWVAQNKNLIDQKIHETIGTIKTGVSEIKGVYESIPEELRGPAGVGLVGTVLFGPKGGLFLGVAADALNRQREFVEALEGVKAGVISLEDLNSGKVAFDTALSQWRKVKTETGAVTKAIDQTTAGYERYVKAVKAAAEGTKNTWSNTGVITEMSKAEMQALDDLIKAQGEVKKSWYDIDRQTYASNDEDAVKAANAYYDAWAKGKTDALSAAAAIASAMDQMYKDIGLQGEENYEYQVGLLEAQAQARKDLGVDEVLVERWKNSEIENLEKQKTLDSNNFFAGMKIGLQDSQTDFRTWAEHGESISRSMSSNMHSAFSDSLFLALKGDIDDISQVWDGFLDSMLYKVTDTVSEMAVQWGIGAIGGVTGWWDTGAWEIKRDHVAMVHEGEMIVPADVAEIIRNGSGRDSISDLAQVSPSGGHEWSPEQADVIGGFFKGSIGSYAQHAAQGVSLAAQGHIGLNDLAKGLVSPAAIAGSMITGGTQGAMVNALGLQGKWSKAGQFLGSMLAVMEGVPMASGFAGALGGFVFDKIGDAFNARGLESLRDAFEDSPAGARGFKNFVKGMGEGGWDTEGMTGWGGFQGLGIGNPGSYGGSGNGVGDGGSYGGYGGADDGSDNDNSGIGGWAEGGVIDRLMVPYGEDGWAAVQFGEGVVSKKGMETLAKINKGNLEGYSADENADVINITNNIQAEVLGALGNDLPTDLKLQRNGIILDDMTGAVELFNLILEDGIDSTELETAYQSFIGIGLAAQDAAVATNLLIDEYEKQERAAKDAEQALDAQLAQREKQSQSVSNLEIQALNALGEKGIATELSRALDLKSMDTSLHPLQQFIWSLEDAAEATDDFSSAFSNIDNAINNIMTGGAMGVQSVGYYERRYSELMSDAYADPTKVGAFTTFANSYLNFMSDYGDPRVMEQVLADLNALQDTVESEITMADQITGGKTLSDLYELLAQTDGWDPGMGAIESMVTDAYADIGRFNFGTRPDQIDRAGFDYWVDELVSGDISPKDFPLAFSTAAGIWGETETGWRRQDEFSFSGGGVISGPMSGYTLPTTFHGVERIVPETDFQDMTNLLRQLVNGPIGGGDIQVRVYIGNQELRSHTADVIRTDPETQNQIRRVARV